MVVIEITNNRILTNIKSILVAVMVIKFYKVIMLSIQDQCKCIEEKIQ